MKHWIVVVGLFVIGCDLDNEGKNQCEVQADCLDGFVCNATTGTCEEPLTTCTPLTCEANQCGSISDGCGGTVECGGCEIPFVCGGGGENVCGVRPDTCSNGMSDLTKGETGVDCGGPCGGCPTGSGCKVQGDCETGTCESNVCFGGRWSSVQEMPTPRLYLSAVLANDGLVYAIGGGSGGLSNVVEAYNPATNSWTTRAPLGVPRYGSSAVIGPDNKIYVIGGTYDASTYTDGNSVVVEAYTPSTNTWARMPDLPNGRYKGASVTAANGRIYAFGGFSVNPSVTLNDAVSWAPGETSWTAVPDVMTRARSGHAGAATSDGRIYAIGGYVSGPEIPTLEYHLPGTQGWHTLAPLPTPRKDLGVALSGGKLYVMGGNVAGTTNMAFTRTTDVYDPSTNTWSQVASAPYGRYGHATVTLADGRIMVLGGRYEANTASSSASVDVYTPDP